jgi:hypothetical protein
MCERFLFLKETRLDGISENNTLKLVLEPLDSVFLGNLLMQTYTSLTDLASADTSTRPCKVDEKVHSVDTGGGIVLDTQINVLGDSKTKVSGITKVLLQEFIFLHLEATLQNFQGLFTADGNMDGDLFVTTDTEGSEGITGLRVDGLLSSKLLEHTGGAGQSISGFADAAVENQLVDLNFLHAVYLSFGHLDVGILFGGIEKERV